MALKARIGKGLPTSEETPRARGGWVKRERAGGKWDGNGKEEGHCIQTLVSCPILGDILRLHLEGGLPQRIMSLDEELSSEESSACRPDST